MKETEFAILHDIDNIGQFLVNTTFDHDEEKFILTLKYWSESINGYVELSLKWDGDDNGERLYEENFAKFKNIDYCKEWVEKIESTDL